VLRETHAPFKQCTTQDLIKEITAFLKGKQKRRGSRDCTLIQAARLPADDTSRKTKGLTWENTTVIHAKKHLGCFDFP
jgi:hypothetical protein